jgi:hypothetical protein
LPSGGKADVYLDNNPAETIDVHLDAEEERGNESVFHRFGLAAGSHTIRLVVRGEPYEGNLSEKKGRDVVLKDLVVFR